MTTPFQFLKKVNNDYILTCIVSEHPQTIAVIVSCVQREPDEQKPTGKDKIVNPMGKVLPCE